MSSFPLDQVHGDHLRKEITPEPLDIETFYPLADVVNKSTIEVIEVVTMTGHSGPQYRLKDSDNTFHFFNALTGKPLPAIDEAQAIKIAQSIYTGTAPLFSSSKVTTKSTEYRRRLPAWRIEFDDIESATLYIAVDNGQLMSVRNTMWRIFDFVWMLHIMDYENRTDFNSWLLIFASLFAFITALSGVYLIFKTFRRRDFGFK